MRLDTVALRPAAESGGFPADAAALAQRLRALGDRWAGSPPADGARFEQARRQLERLVADAERLAAGTGGADLDAWKEDAASFLFDYEFDLDAPEG